MATRATLLDVGGTFIKCSDGREIPINSAGTREEIVSSLRRAAGDADAVAVAIPGPFDYATGTFLMKHKFAAVYGERFQDLCYTDGGVKPVFCYMHDVNAMLAGEMAAGAGKAYARVALVTLGTGLGFSMSLDGQILANSLGSPAVSLYNLPYRDGILEDYASKRGFLRGYEGITVKELAGKALSGDTAAASRFEEVGAILAEAISPVLSSYGIECLLFGGQISRSFSLFGPSLGAGLNGNVACLRHIGPVSDIGNATFNGLKTLL